MTIRPNDPWNPSAPATAPRPVKPDPWMPANTFDAGLSDKWRYSLAEVRECLMFIKQHRETIEQRNDRLSTGTRRHRPTAVTFARKTLALRLRMYLDAVRRVSEAEAEMLRIGMQFARSSDAWPVEQMVEAA